MRKCDFAALELLGDGMEVAEAALEGRLCEDRAGACRIVEQVGGRLRLVNREGGGEADADPVLDFQPVCVLRCRPDVLDLGKHEGARRAYARDGLRGLVLDEVVVGEAGSVEARGLVLRQRHKGVQHAFRDAERGAGKAHGIHVHAGEEVERRLVLSVVGVVPDRGVGSLHEAVLQRVAVARRAAQADRVPDILDLYA